MAGERTVGGLHPPRDLTRRGFLRGLATASLGVAGSPALDRLAVPASAAASDHLLTPRRPRVHEHWLQADAFLHDLVPSRRDGMTGQTYAPDQTSYWALGYRAYTPGWGRPLPGDELIGENSGIPGPVIRAAVGDVVRIHFRNNDTHYGLPHSIHPHGVRYTPASDGGYVASDPDAPGTGIRVGQSYTYEWTVRHDSVGTWPYHDHSVAASVGGGTPIMEIGAELGLFGVIVVTDAATPPVDREFLLFFHDLYRADVPSLAQDFDCFNGRAFLGNTPTVSAMVGDRVRWRVVALGKEFHVFHVHGHRWRAGGVDQDSAVLGPSTTLTVEYVEREPGRWLYHCHVTDHMMGGMVGLYIVDR